MSGVRLNFSIPEKLSKDLAAYCEGTGRSGADLIRQLVLELLDGDRTLNRLTNPSPDVCAREGARSSLLIMDWMYNQVETLANSFGVTKSVLIRELLLSFFLEKCHK